MAPGRLRAGCGQTRHRRPLIVAYPVWHLLDRAFPGAKLLNEPFRYGLGAAFGLAVCAAYAGRVAAYAVPLWLAELVFVSPVPVPLPVAPIEIPPAYSRLEGDGEALVYHDRDYHRLAGF